ncbi:hypothetical protein [Amycolatopsis sp. H20-H5]|uniref:hypothetical protein n=1 Tax=Amycolatopsis sp. H20-H5 TaxID=3046309 RepID=UPI002DB60B42|nr:hypothetical protein [Amycolatopsis sp. H20-H5]MEC3975834.1 hypothetical protein [Amycolatopsis sp. H20-H5]
MSVHVTSSLVEQMIGRMLVEFRGQVPLGVVAATVERAHRELSGRIEPEAAEDMLGSLSRHRLIRYRRARANGAVVDGPLWFDAGWSE